MELLKCIWCVGMHLAMTEHILGTTNHSWQKYGSLWLEGVWIHVIMLDMSWKVIYQFWKTVQTNHDGTTRSVFYDSICGSCKTGNLQIICSCSVSQILIKILICTHQRFNYDLGAKFTIADLGLREGLKNN